MCRWSAALGSFRAKVARSPGIPRIIRASSLASGWRKVRSARASTSSAARWSTLIAGGQFQDAHVGASSREDRVDIVSGRDVSGGDGWDSRFITDAVAGQDAEQPAVVGTALPDRLRGHHGPPGGTLVF